MLSPAIPGPLSRTVMLTTSPAGVLCGPGQFHRAAAGQGVQPVEQQVQQNLFQAMPVRRHLHSGQAVPQADFDAGAARQRRRKFCGPVEQLAEIGGSASGFGQAVKCKTLFTVAARLRIPACRCSTHSRTRG